MKRYFRAEGDSRYSDTQLGVSYYEFDGQYCTRQIDLDGDVREYFEQHIGSEPPNRNMLDKPLSSILTSDAEEITAHEFEAVWNKVSKGEI